MIRLPILLLSLLFFISTCNGQTHVVEIREKKNSNNQYKDFAYDGEKIWGLTTEGKLVLFDATNGDPISGKVNNESPIIVLANDKEGNIFIGDKSKSVKKYDRQSQSWRTLLKFDNTLLAIAFDSKNNYYLITNKGVFDNSTKNYFYPDSSLNFQRKKGTDWFKDPVLLTDKNDNIWIGFEYGEWGGELFIFNPTDRKFIIPNLKGFPITLNPIKSIFEGRENVFVTSGLTHFVNRGSIVKFDNFQSNFVFKNEDNKKFPNVSTNNEISHAEYIGPGVYNDKDNCIYFYSQNGIFKGNPQNDLSKIENWTKVLDPKLHWSNGQSDAIGALTNVLKLKFINNDRLIILSQNDGIGIYDGKTLIKTR